MRSLCEMKNKKTKKKEKEEKLLNQNQGKISSRA